MCQILKKDYRKLSFFLLRLFIPPLTPPLKPLLWLSKWGEPFFEQWLVVDEQWEEADKREGGVGEVVAVCLADKWVVDEDKRVE